MFLFGKELIYLTANVSAKNNILGYLVLRRPETWTHALIWDSMCLPHINYAFLYFLYFFFLLREHFSLWIIYKIKFELISRYLRISVCMCLICDLVFVIHPTKFSGYLHVTLSSDFNVLSSLGGSFWFIFLMEGVCNGKECFKC